MRTAGAIAGVVLGLALTTAGAAQGQDARSPDPPEATGTIGGVAQEQQGAQPESRGSRGVELEIGQPPPDFELKATDGKTYKLSELKDKTVVLLWDSKDCRTSRGLMPQIKGTASKYIAKGVVWLAIDSTPGRKFEDNVKYVEQEKLPFPYLDDSSGKTGKAYGARVTPTFYVVHKGKLVYSGAMVPRRGERNYLAEALDAVLDGKEVALAQTTAWG